MFQYNIGHMEHISLLKTTQCEPYGTAGLVSVFLNSGQKALDPTDNRTPVIQRTVVSIPTELSQPEKVITRT
jgi:hypothetical protein